MERFTYEMPLCEEYKLSNLLPGETVEDFGYQHEPLTLYIGRRSGVASMKTLFEPVDLENSDPSSKEDIVKAIRKGHCNGWEPCSVCVTHEGLRVSVVNLITKKQAVFRLTQSFSLITIRMRTWDREHSKWHHYEYRETYKQKTGRHLIELVEYDDNVKIRRAIRWFTKNKDAHTESSITECS